MKQEERDAWVLNYLKPRLSQLWTWFPVRKEVKAASAVYIVVGRKRELLGYRCNICGLVSKETETDHVIPKGVFPKTLLDLPGYLDRYYPLEGLQQLCKACHAPKTKIDIKRMKKK